MPTEILSTAHLDYLQRTGTGLAPLSAKTSCTSAPLNLRRLWRIKGVGRAAKQPVPSNEQRVRLPSEDLLIGLNGPKIPLGFLLRGEPGGVAIYLGAWSPAGRESASKEVLDERLEILRAALNSLYSTIALERPGDDLPSQSLLPLSGLVLGIPTIKRPDPLDGALPHDRLIRSLYGANWACLVLAEPVDESVASDLRRNMINEMRRVEAAAQAERTPSPLTQHYLELLQEGLKTLTLGLAVGMWRTGVYLLGDTESYYRLASTWRGIFSGDESLLEPVRVWDSTEAGALAVNWAMPDVPGARGPGHYHHPLQYQTVLTSSQLAAYMHLPNVETSGFAVNAVPHFDAVVLGAQLDQSLSLGKIVHRTRMTETDYRVSRKALTRHVFTAGVTGAGKTNTIFHLLKQADALGVPFLVIEPAKTEYRALLEDPDLRGKLQIFTLGDENVSPFRLNAFEVPPRIPVGVHLDLLRSAFTASFGMWTPLPQVLEQCLHRVYEDRGWDITTNTNSRLDSRSDISAAFPTLSDLAAKVDEVTRQLGYEDRVTSDIRAALLTRINSLRTGGKGRMLDVQHSLPMELLLESPTILELERMGDDDDKAFVMGLLFIRLVEHRRASGAGRDLRHLLVIEEAHRLLANVGRRGREEEADPRGKAVESFANLLSEIRAYGQGVIIADQVPVKLAPDVIKNTNLKIAHRVVAADDRAALAGAMAMDEPQAHALATLTTGQAAVFSEGDDAPLLVQVPPVKDQSAQRPPDDERVADHMLSLKTRDAYRTLFEPLSGYVDMSVPGAAVACEAARALVHDLSFRRDFVRFVISVTEEDDALDRLWDGLLAREQAVRPRGVDEGSMRRYVLIHASKWFAGRRGSQAGWTYAETAELEDRLRELLLTRLEGKHWTGALKSFRACMHRLHQRPFEPFPRCAKICTQGPLCLYRQSVADLVIGSMDTRRAKWTAAYLEDTKEAKGLPRTWEICRDAAYEIIEENKAQREAIRRIGLCYAQHMLAEDFPEIHDVILKGLLSEAKSVSEEGEKDE